MDNPCKVIKLDKNTSQIYYPTLLLMTRAFSVLGKVSKYYNWNMSLTANGVDEISFDINKFYYDEYGNKIICPIWNDLIDLKIIDVDGFGRYEISVSYTDSTETIKSIHGQSLEVELGQLMLHDFHINDEEAVAGDITQYNKMHFDEEGNFIPTVFYNPDDEDNSLLHRVLKDKAPHWSLGYITPYVTLGEDEACEKSNDFIRTYTVDGTSIYDFLTGDVAKETNVVFIFDTTNRIINCYSLEDCYDKDSSYDSRVLLCPAIGNDTNIMISKRKLAQEIGIESNKDDVKNCFRVMGGDDLITSQVAAVNMNGSNYIYQFADFQLDDMPAELKNKIISYNELCDSRRNEYYGENGIYPRLCNAFEEYNYLKSGMMPSTTLVDTDAQTVYEHIVNGYYNTTVGWIDGLTTSGVGMKSLNSATTVKTISNNVLAMAQVYADSRYNVTIESEEYDGVSLWTGQIKVVRATDETDYYPKATAQLNNLFNVNLYTDDDNLLFTKQKIEKQLSKSDMTGVNKMLSEIQTDEELEAFCEQYCLVRLESFKDGFQNCLSVLIEVGNKTNSEIWQQEYDAYSKRLEIVTKVYEKRQEQVDAKQKEIDNITIEQAEFQAELDFKSYLGTDLWKIYCCYVREDDYSNSNYISDNLTTTTEYLDKAKELLDVATVQIKKACVLQRTVSTSLHNLLLLPEFENLYESFALFNYIRVACEDEMFKLRILGINFDGNNYSDIQVTFAEEIESLDGTVSTLSSVIQQAQSISTSYDATMLQAKQGKQANTTMTDLAATGLDASTVMLKNSDNNEVVINGAGILASTMTDEGQYDNKQVRIIGNGIYMTDDKWATAPKLALGEINVNGVTKYGINAEVLQGHQVLADEMFIGNATVQNDSTVKLDKDGLYVKGKVADSTFYNVSINATDNKIFNIYEGNDVNNSIMYIDNTGSGYYKGNLQCGDITSATDETNDGVFISSDGKTLRLNSTITDENNNTIKVSQVMNGNYFQITSTRLSDGLGGTITINPNWMDNSHVIEFNPVNAPSGSPIKRWFISATGSLNVVN